MARGSSKHSRCVHEPVLPMGTLEAANVEAMAGEQKLAFVEMPQQWYCAKCKRKLVARWYVPVERGI